jgi:hypothetical protein
VVHGRVPIVSFVLQSVKFDLLFATFPFPVFPEGFRNRRMELVEMVSTWLREEKVAIARKPPRYGVSLATAPVQPVAADCARPRPVLVQLRRRSSAGD